MNEAQLIKYLNNELSEKERNAVEQFLAENPFWEEGLEGLEQWKEHSNISYNELQTTLHEKIDAVTQQKVETTTDNKTQIVRMPIFRIIAVAATIVGILFFSVHYLYEQRMRTENIYAAHFKVLTHPDGTVRGEQLNEEADFSTKATQYYERENYKKAIEYYKKALEQHPNSEKNILFLGVSYLANFEPENAIDVFTSAATSENQYLNDRNWYLAMAYLKIKNVDLAKGILVQLSKSESFYTQSSKEILEELGEESYTVQQ
jgi:tetratricopeptide (TPR) repeat protein